MKNLSELSNLELAGLLCSLVAVIGIAENIGFGELYYQALGRAANEVGARGKGGHAGPHLFGEKARIPLHRRGDFLEFTRELARTLESNGFSMAASLLNEAAREEVKSFVPADVGVLHGRELRMH